MKMRVKKTINAAGLPERYIQYIGKVLDFSYVKDAGEYPYSSSDGSYVCFRRDELEPAYKYTNEEGI